MGEGRRAKKDGTYNLSFYTQRNHTKHVLIAVLVISFILELVPMLMYFRNLFLERSTPPRKILKILKTHFQQKQKYCRG